MTSASTRLSRVSAGTALALVCSAPAIAASTDYFLKIKGIEGDSGKAQAQDDKHKNQIEILSWSWGEPQAGKVEMNWKVEEGESAAAKQLKQDSIAIKQTTHAAEATRANDRLRNTGPRDDWGAQATGKAEITLKGNAGTGGAGAKPHRPSDVTLKRGTAAAAGGVSVAAGDVNGDGAAASGLPTGKRQHKPLVVTAPLDKGSVSLTLNSAWADCRVGARYPELELGTGGRTYQLHHTVITSCGAESSGGDRPTESLSLNYERIK